MSIFSSITSSVKSLATSIYKTQKILPTPAASVLNNPKTAATIVAGGIALSALPAATIAAIPSAMAGLGQKIVSSAPFTKAATGVVLTGTALALTNPKLVSPQNLGTTAAFAVNPLAAGVGLITKEVSRQKEVFTDPNISVQQKVLTAAADIVGLGIAGGAVYATGKYFGDVVSQKKSQGTVPIVQPTSTAPQIINYFSSIPETKEEKQEVKPPIAPAPLETPVVTPTDIKKVKKKKAVKKKAVKKKAKKKAVVKKKAKKKAVAKKKVKKKVKKRKVYKKKKKKAKK